MLMIATLFGTWPTLELVAFAMAYGAVQMGIILVNTAEDYPEDREAAVRTVIVALGLSRGIALASALVTTGAAVMLVTLATLYWVRGVPLLRSIALLPAAAACLWLINAIRRLSREVTAEPLEIGIVRVKAAAKNVPAWVTVVAWTSFAAVAVLFLYSSKLF
jgi:4-hydroxybenzoate polyprenyltransferase